ncbi:MAG: sulfotransferase [Fuerstiella sp.]
MSVTEQEKDISETEGQSGCRAHRFLFVGGSARSGTTLIQKMLCAHTQVCGGPEFDHAVPAMQLFARMTSKLQLERQKFYYTESEVTARFREFYASLFDGLVSRHPGVTYVSEKTPANIAAAADLLKLFPDAFYINVVRDGRDVVLSHQKVLKRFRQQHGKKGKKWWHEYSVRDVSRKWNADISRYLEMMATPSISSRVLNVRYEDVVTRPKDVLEPLLERLGLPMQEQLLQPESVAKEQLGYTVNVDGVWYTDGMFSQSLNSLSVSGWQQNLSLPKRLLANFMQCRNLQTMGYPVAPWMIRLRHLIDRLRGRRS